LWDVTIDGRLARLGLSSPEVRAQRAREFAAMFPMLGGEAGRFFDEWFDLTEPTHDGLVEFALHPPLAGDRAGGGRCPLCRFPVASLDEAPGRMSPDVRRDIEREHPGWRLADGLCTQCLDLYISRAV
jgi:hypothetical protein